MKGGVSAIRSLHCSFEWHLHSVPLHLIWFLTVHSLPLTASQNSQLSCLPHIWLAYNYAHSILHCIKMMSSWLPANLFKSAPAQRSQGEEEGRGRVTRVGARAAGWGAGSPAAHPSCCPVCAPGAGVQGCPGAIQAHLGARGWAGTLLACQRPAPNPSALAFMKDIYTLQVLRLVGLQTGFCLSPRRWAGKGETWANSAVDF